MTTLPGMDENAMGGENVTIQGTVTGGPLDGCTFALPATGGVRGAYVSLCVNGTWHIHTLMPSGLTNVLSYRGVQTRPASIDPADAPDAAEDV